MKLKLDWSAYKDAGMGDAYADIPKQGDDYAKAIAVCINSGQCETLSKQVMCPSYKVSENPDWSTGGRVRKLKQALNKHDWQVALDDPVLAQAMDLCVSCKGCKRECDSNVDMALIKSEYLAWKAERQGIILRSKLFARMPELLHRYPWLKLLIALRNRRPWLQRLTQRWLGISAAMPLPQPVNNSFDATKFEQGTNEVAISVDSNKPEVVLFVDTFGRYFEPQIAEDAYRLLTKLGYRVRWLDGDINKNTRPLCCGRTYLAQGLVEQARTEVSRLIDALIPHVSAGRTIVGLEASCVLGLRDDAKALGLKPEQLKAIADNTHMLEEFLAKEIMAKRLQLPKLEQSPQTLVHGHCHQKAVGALKTVRRVLKQFKGLDYSMIESGCCGMAGTFSLEAEHQKQGAAMAEHGLLPTLKENPGATVIANGFSCRQQMRALSSHQPKHLASYLCEVLNF